MLTRTVPLILALALVLAARSAEGAGDECPAHMERAAFDAVTKQLDWAELHDAYSSRLQPVLAAPSSEAL